jgi:chaperonin cofactor prefoldin
VNGSAAKPGGGSWSTFSDVRLKQIDDTYDRGLEEILQLNPVRYQYKEGNELGLPTDKKYVGVVSQEVQDVIPEAVEEDAKGHLMVNNEPVIWAMVNAIKQLKTENETLQRRIEALERQLNRQRNLSAIDGVQPDVR